MIDARPSAVQAWGVAGVMLACASGALAGADGEASSTEVALRPGVLLPATGYAPAPPSDAPASTLTRTRLALSATLARQDPEASPADGAGGQQDLATKLQNPIADLISIPIQLNWDTGIGPDDDKDRLVINIQPVIPISLGDDWNVISRTIVPIVYAESPAPGGEDAFGLGDTLQSFFFTPKDPIGGWILGAGPAASIPTGTDDLFRSEQLALGPTGIALRQQPLGGGMLTYGGLANHLWRVAGGDGEPDVNATFLQPFLSYTLKGGTSFTLNAEASYTWEGGEWSVPVNAFISQLTHLGSQPVQFQFGGRYYLDTVPGGPEWGLRFGITFLFPK